MAGTTLAVGGTTARPAMTKKGGAKRAAQLRANAAFRKVNNGCRSKFSAMPTILVAEALVVDGEQAGVDLLAGVGVVERDGGVVALWIGDGPLLERQILRAEH